MLLPDNAAALRHIEKLATKRRLRRRLLHGQRRNGVVRALVPCPVVASPETFERRTGVQLPRPIVRLIARGKPLVPASLWPVLNTAASARGSGPLVADPAPARTLVLCAHPDDELVVRARPRSWLMRGHRCALCMQREVKVREDRRMTPKKPDDGGRPKLPILVLHSVRANRASSTLPMDR